jgi:hypothetical protein
MKAADFELPGVDGKRHSPASARGAKGLVVMFICNHCPYVKRSLDRILQDGRELAALGVGSIAVMPNDTVEYPEDGFDNMKTQDVARAYGVVCTPEFYGYDSALELRYHGRIDELAAAMRQVAATGSAPKEQRPSVGCSIKWKR